MNIKIQNLGAIKEACIDLNKKLTVFCGPNNTGKTYVSYIIYALTNGAILEPEVLPDDKMKALINEKHFELDINFDDLYMFREKQISLVKDNLDNIFGISEDKVKSYFGNFELSFLTLKEDFQNKIKTEGFVLKLTSNEWTVKVTKHPDETKVLVENLSEKKLSGGESLHFFSYQLLPIIYNCIAFYPNSTSVIFPVERNSIYTFNKELSIQRNMLVDQMQDLSANKKLNPWDLLMKRTTRYPLAVRAGLEIADDLVNLQNHKSPYYAFADELENELLKGKVSISKDGEVQFLSDKAKTTKIPIHLTASIVKTLASLTFYLRYLAKNNELIIIDEPELNLHPDSQIILARIFARLLNNGFRLLISTHSDYIIRELNNLIMLSSATPSIKKRAKDFGYKDDEYILYNEVNAYLFNHKARGKVNVKSIPVTEAGFEVETIDAAISGLNNISEELYYTMKYGEE